MKRFLVLFITLLTLSGGVSAKETLLGNSQVGVDFSFLGALAGTDEGIPYYAGTVTYAKKNTSWELAFPFFFTQFTFDEDVCCEVHIKRFDLQARKYFKTTRSGPYIGLVGRVSNVLGRDRTFESQRVSATRTGVGMVLGLRAFVYKNFYWGSNFQYGAFLDDGLDLADGSPGFNIFGPLDYGSSRFFNVEIFKVGLRF